MDSGILRVDAEGINVDLSHLVWAKPYGVREEIKEFFKKQGYAEAEKLPYKCQQDCLIVNSPSKEAIALGWHEAVDADGIPF